MPGENLGTHQMICQLAWRKQDLPRLLQRPANKTICSLWPRLPPYPWTPHTGSDPPMPALGGKRQDWYFEEDYFQKNSKEDDATVGGPENREGCDQGYRQSAPLLLPSRPELRLPQGPGRTMAGNDWKPCLPLSARQRGLLPQTPAHPDCCPSASQGRAQLAIGGNEV